MSATSAGTMIAADAPARPWPAMAQPTDGDTIISTDEHAKVMITNRKIVTQPTRWPSLPPSITNAATARPYITMVVPTVVGGTSKSSTMPPIETGSAATLNDIKTCPKNRQTIG